MVTLFLCVGGCQTGPFGVLCQFWGDFLTAKNGLSQLNPNFVKKIRVELAQLDCGNNLPFLHLVEPA